MLFQVCFLALLLEERGKGDLGRVARGTTDKLVRRHPHVFGDDARALEELPTQARTASEVRQNWDAIKQGESPAGEPFGSLPENLPALLHARKLLRRATRTEPSPWEALASIARAVGEAERTIAEKEAERDALYDRIGALLFACVELSATVDVDPETALRRCAEAFRQRVEGGT